MTRRPALRSTCLLVGLVLVAAAGPGAPAVPSRLVLSRPVDGAVLAGFDAPTRYGPGHRGVDLAADPGTPVTAAAPGTVTFAGTVVDAAWVTVDHGGLRTTVGPLSGIDVSRGQHVSRGTRLGTSGHAHGRAAVHWSARRGEVYVDPLAVTAPVATLVDGSLGHGRGRPGGGPGWPRGRVR